MTDATQLPPTRAALAAAIRDCHCAIELSRDALTHLTERLDLLERLERATRKPSLAFVDDPGLGSPAVLEGIAAEPTCVLYCRSTGFAKCLVGHHDLSNPFTAIFCTPHN